MARRLVAFGCSNTYGHGLSDCYKDGRPGRLPSNFAWPSLLADKLDITVDNKGQPGASNKRIWHNGLHYDYTENDTVIFMWSYLTRYSILHKSHETHENKRRDQRVNLHVNQSEKPSRYYFKHIYDDYDSTQQLLAFSSQIYHMLKDKNIKSYHIFADYNKFDDKFYKLLPQSMDWKHWGFHWEENKLDVADDGMHNGPQSHAAWADKIFNWIKE